MAISVSVLYDGRTYYKSFEEDKVIVISELMNSDICVPDFDKKIMVHYENSNIVLEINDGTRKRVSRYALNQSINLDNERMRLYFSETISCRYALHLPIEGEVFIGKSKEIGSDGRKNDVIIKEEYLADYHFKIVSKNKDIFVYDISETGELFFNSRYTNITKLHTGDIISVYNLRIIIMGNWLYFTNVREDKIEHLNEELEYRKAAVLCPYERDQKMHKRSVRIMTRVQDEVIDLEKPPQTNGLPQFNWLNILVMPMISVVLMLVLVMTLGMSPIMLIMSGVMSAVSAIIAIINYRSQKKRHMDRSAIIEKKYLEYLESVKSQLEISRQKQKGMLVSENPSTEECLEIARNKDGRLWSRTVMDEDFLHIRIGTGIIKSKVYARFQQAKVVIEENKLENEAKKLAEESVTISDAPILCNLFQDRQVGLVGERQFEIQLMRNVITQIATTHSYNDVKIITLVPKQELHEWEWARWLPHSTDETEKERYLFTSLEDAEKTLDSVFEILDQRKTEEDRFGRCEYMGQMPYYIFIAGLPSVLEKHPIRKHLLSENNNGCSVIWVYDHLSRLPKECSKIIDIYHNQGYIYNHYNSTHKIEFYMDSFHKDEADSFARMLAPLNIVAEGKESSLPTSVSLLEGYGVNEPESLDITSRWNQAKTYKTLSVPIGITSGNQVFYFDIHEKKHGINGIVAGMPGSGKTEMVQSWLLSMAINYSPQDVSFVLIDFKGSGMVAPFKKLPHLAGSISNLDAGINRNLTAIQSEVHRRERIIDKYSHKNIKNVNDLNENYAKGLVPERLPIMLIVIDEFAEFKKEYPEFGAEIDSLTSKGRALGMFVILMTQKPAGVVSSKSEDNIKFRWCLRVANYGASREMLGRPDAARISNPGRAYVKVGEDDVYEEVQSFWSGAPYNPVKGHEKNQKGLISLIDIQGNCIIGEKNITKVDSESYEAEIDVVVRHICQYCEKMNIANAEKVWSEPLSEIIILDEILNEKYTQGLWPEKTKTAPVIGIMDNPSEQKQYPLQLDFASLGHIVVYGAPVTGKTTLLQTVIMSTALIRKPDEVSIYVMDFGGWNMNVLKTLPHVGEIVNDNEPERIKKLALLIQDQYENRKELFLKEGVGNISSYRSSLREEEDNIPDILLVIDNFGPVLKLYPELEQFFITITRSGANYGIYLIMSANASNAVPMRISQNIKYALTLQMIDKSEYTYIVGKVNEILPAVMGRGYAKGNPPLEFQTALPSAGKDDKERFNHIAEIAKEMNHYWNGNLPARIPEMPDYIAYGSVSVKGICVGLSTEKVLPVCMDFEKQHYLMISGTTQSGKTSMVQTLTKQLYEKKGGSVYAFDVSGNCFDEIKPIAKAYLTGGEEIDDFIENLRPELRRRQTEKMQNNAASFDPIIISIDDYTQFFKAVSNESILRLVAIVKIGAGLDLYLIANSDSNELSSMINKGEALAVSMVKGKTTVALGGCLNDHGAVQTKASYTQKGIMVREHEGFFVVNNETLMFKAMDCREGE